MCPQSCGLAAWRLDILDPAIFFRAVALECVRAVGYAYGAVYKLKICVCVYPIKASALAPVGASARLVLGLG